MDTNTRTERRQLRWESVGLILRSASGIAWDGCHKIYVLMDQPQVEQMRQYGYTASDSSLMLAADAGPELMLDTLQQWFRASCPLRFIDAVRTVDGETDSNEGFTALIPQFEEDFWPEPAGAE